MGRGAAGPRDERKGRREWRDFTAREGEWTRRKRREAAADGGSQRRRRDQREERINETGDLLRRGSASMKKDMEEESLP